jgi:NAD(P)H-flavin reductase
MTRCAPAMTSNPWLSQRAVIREIRPEIADVVTYRLQLADREANAAYRFLPGQFNMLYLPGAGEVAISVSACVDGFLEHTIRAVGSVTRAMEQLRVGATLGLRGPFGASWPMAQCQGQDVIVVTGGIGLAPLRPVIHELIHNRSRYGRITLLYGARTPDTLLYEKQFAGWIGAGLEIHTTVDRSAPGWHGNVGVVPLLVDRQSIPDPRHTQILACGPEVMMRYTVLSALDRGIAKEQIWLSLERNMQCAVGFCGHCQLGPAFVCKDGPVFRFDKIEPFLQVEGL